jgi:ABC-type transport system involved in cytochrome c biogenesis permease subunit
MDPIVAVLRSNYWLTIHVLTITISYAALTIAMLIGNAALLRTIFSKNNAGFFKEYAHYAYRMIQLGVFLLTVGIILGGIWADYSWGRFWGWDPKETWALIADVGFIALLHARYIGWIRDFGILAFSPVAYLLVIMAWYGVNFILAAGLHSYGFSSGGAMMVTGFVTAQLLLFGAAAAKVWARRQTT